MAFPWVLLVVLVIVFLYSLTFLVFSDTWDDYVRREAARLPPNLGTLFPKVSFSTAGRALSAFTAWGMLLVTGLGIVVVIIQLLR